MKWVGKLDERTSEGCYAALKHSSFSILKDWSENDILKQLNIFYNKLRMNNWNCIHSVFILHVAVVLIVLYVFRYLTLFSFSSAKTKSRLKKKKIEFKKATLSLLNTWKEIYKLSLSSCPFYTSVRGRTRGFSAFSLFSWLFLSLLFVVLRGLTRPAGDVPCRRVPVTH